MTSGVLSASGNGDSFVELARINFPGGWVITLTLYGPDVVGPGVGSVSGGIGLEEDTVAMTCSESEGMAKGGDGGAVINGSLGRPNSKLVRVDE